MTESMECRYGMHRLCKMAKTELNLTKIEYCNCDCHKHKIGNEQHEIINEMVEDNAKYQHRNKH